MSAMLDVGVRPEAAGRIVVALVEQGIEGFEDESLILFRGSLGSDHISL